MKLFVFILALSFASPNRSSDHPLPSWNVKFQMHDHHFELYSVEDADVGFVDLNQAPNDPLHLILETKLVGKSFYISRLSHSFTLSLSLSPNTHSSFKCGATFSVATTSALFAWNIEIQRGTDNVCK